MRHIRIIAVFTACQFMIWNAYSTEMISFHAGWKFTLGNPANAHQKGFPDDEWSDVRIPHDWAIVGPFDPGGDANTGKLPWRGQGWYRKTFALPENLRDQRIIFLFDGIMAFPKVYINGELAGEWDYGYSSFYLDVTDLVHSGDGNLIAIHVDTRDHDSRWYPGAGIYRDVHLIVKEDVHVPVWGTYITTPAVEENWTDVRALTEVVNTGDVDQEVTVLSRVLSPQGSIIAVDTLTGSLAAGGADIYEQWFTLPAPRRWDVQDPVLYSVITTILVDGQQKDEQQTPFGIRTFRFTADDGFWLNGRRLQMKGVNLHHDNGPLGAKFYRRAMQRKIEVMKAMGVNAIRNSHNIESPVFLNLCDSMGLLVFNEAYDKWDAKAGILPDADPFESLERNLINFVKRDRNHPSVVLWSVGNEMRDVQGNADDGLQKLALATNVVRRYDPTRPLTIANDQEDGVRWRHYNYYDVHSWNYGRRYRPAREAEPSMAVIISESASTLSTRGYYELPLPDDPTAFTGTGQISSYDLHAPWWAEIPEEDFMYQEEDEYVCGEFVWTGFDYLGEPTPYNNFWAERNDIPIERAAKSSYFGIVDLCGIPKDRYYLYKSYWEPEETTVHILPHWNWEGREGDTIPVFVYTNGNCAELFLNGTSLGMRCKQPKSEMLTERYRLMWHDAVYQPGMLTAIAYKEGQRIGEAQMKTAGPASQLQCTADRTALKADGTDLSYVLIEALDANGYPAPLADNLLSFDVTGAGLIEGVGNGNPQSLEPFVADERKLFYGKAMLILRSGENPGSIGVNVSAEGLQGCKLELNAE